MTTSRRLRILVFDDDLVHRTDFLDGLPADFIYRAHADDAVADVELVAPDVVFMDFSMGPHVDGAEAVRRLRERFPIERLPIVAISSDARMNRVMLMAGANDGVPKMAVPERFREILQAFDDGTGTR